MYIVWCTCIYIHEPNNGEKAMKKAYGDTDFVGDNLESSNSKDYFCPRTFILWLLSIYVSSQHELDLEK